MTLKELKGLLNQLKEEYKDDRNKRITRKSLLEGDIPIIAKVSTLEGDIIVFSNGAVLFEDMGSYTVFDLRECDGYAYTSIEAGSGITNVRIPYADPIYDPEIIEAMDWSIGISFIGKDHIDRNRRKRNYYTPLENVTYEGVMDYGEIKVNMQRRQPGKYGTGDFTEESDRRVDVEHLTNIITEKQKEVIRSRYWEEKSFQEIGEEQGGDNVSARQRAKGLHDRAIRTIIRNANKGLDGYKK